LDQLGALRVDHAEFEERGPLQGALGALLVGLGQAGNLNQNPVLALGLKLRFGHAEAVDTLAQDFHRLFEGVAFVDHVLEAVGVHCHQERCAALQVEA